MATMTILKKINYKKVGIISVVLILFSILFCIVFVPKLLKGQLKKVSKAKQSRKLIFTLSIFVYILSESYAKAEQPDTFTVGESSFCCDFQSVHFQRN